MENITFFQTGLFISEGMKNILFSILAVVGLKILFAIFIFATKKLFKVKAKIRKVSDRQEQKDKTVFKVIKTAYGYAFRITSIIVVLVIFGLDVATLIASAGMFAIVFTFAAQDLLKDIVAGIFILLEDYYYVGDYIKTNSVEGTVQELGIRATIIAAPTGELHTVLNRQLTSMTNYTTIEGDYFFDFPLPYGSTNANDALNKIKEELNDNLDFETEVVGLFNPTSVSVSVRIHVLEKEHSYGKYCQDVRAAIIKIINI